MALQYSPKIVTDSLVMCLDASQNKSYPTTDLPVKGGLVLWLDAADDSTFSYSSGTSVSQWRDKSGNNRHFFQATAGNQPSRSAVVNSRKAIQFTAASSQYLRYNSKIINNTTGGSVFVAWRTAGETNAYSSILDNYHCGNSALNAGFQIERNVTNNQYYWGFNTPGCGNGGFIPATSYSNDTTNCIWITKDSTTITGGLNGTSTTPTSSPSATWIEDDKGWTIGAWGSGTESFGRFFNGINCEVIIFNRGLSPTEVKQVNTYLGQKWGISNTDRSIVDLSNNNNHGLFGNGTVANMPDYNYYNKSLTYNKGQSDTLVVTNSTSLKNNNTTIELYMKFNSAITSNTGDYIQFGLGSGNYGQYYFRNDSPNLTWSWFPASSATSSSAYAISNFSTDTYYLITLTGDSTGASKMYVNGIQVASAAGGISAVTTWTSNNLTIGGYFWDGYSNSDIALTRIYSRVLSVAEISQNYEAIKSRFANTIVQSGLVLNLDAGNPYSYAGSGTTWYDVSLNGYNATLSTGVVYNSDSGGSMVFDGTSVGQEVNIGSKTINFASGGTFEIWTKIDNVNRNQGFFSMSPGTSYINFYSPGATNQKMRWEVIGNVAVSYNTINSITSLQNNVWYHVVGNFDPSGGSTRIYINGSLDNSQSSYTNVPSSVTSQIIIGEYAGILDGNIAVAKIYNRPLSATEVLQNYNATKGRFGL